jgi:hypothetical protein
VKILLSQKKALFGAGIPMVRLSPPKYQPSSKQRRSPAKGRSSGHGPIFRIDLH